MDLPQALLACVSWILSLAAIALLIPSATFFLECIVALFCPWPMSRSAQALQPRLAVLMPAHNEALGIRATLVPLLAQLAPGDRCLVVADNCEDETAAIARQAGATVLERQDAERRGKGYALDYGLQALAADPPQVVILVDADCEVGPGMINELAQQVMATQRPVQSVYLMEQPPQPGPKDAVSAFAFKVKNLVRPLGLAQLGQPCLLTGTGMAFPWQAIRSVNLASGNIVEDMQLGLDLAIAGYAPQLCATAQVTGRLPQQNDAAQSQRTRWEHGHLQTLFTQGPRLLQAAWQQRRFDLAMLALDLCVPPLSLLVLMWLGLSAIALLVGFMGASWLPAGLLAGSGVMLLTAILGSWAKFGRTELPALTLLSVPFYILWKIPLYLKFLVKPQAQWVRTERDIDPAES